MDNPPQPKSDLAAFCPRCSGALIDFSELSDEGAKCGTCAWTGRRSELLSIPFSHDMGGRDQIAMFFTNDFKNNIIKPFVLPLGQFLMKWGFISKGDPNLRIVLNRYVTVIARGMIRLILEERANIEKEKINGPA